MGVRGCNWILGLGLALGLGGFQLTKWISKNPRVVESVPEEERAKEVKGRIHECLWKGHYEWAGLHQVQDVTQRQAVYQTRNAQCRVLNKRQFGLCRSICVAGEVNSARTDGNEAMLG